MMTVRAGSGGDWLSPYACSPSGTGTNNPAINRCGQSWADPGGSGIRGCGKGVRSAGWWCSLRSELRSPSRDHDGTSG